MQGIRSDHELREFIVDDECNVIFDSGFSVPINKVERQHVQSIVRAVTIHTTLIPIKSELDQIAQGLEICDILSLMKKHPNKFKELFLYSSDDKLSVELMLSIFDIMYSEEGSSRREIEE